MPGIDMLASDEPSARTMLAELQLAD